jgi:hypothetical protein
VSRRRQSFYSRNQSVLSFCVCILSGEAHSSRGHFCRRLALLGLTILGLACERTDNTVIDVNGAVPLLTAVILSPSSINTDSINVGPTRLPEDILQLKVAIFAQATVPAGTQHIGSVAFSVLQEGSSSPLALGKLIDDGSAPDQLKGDGTYSGWATFQIERVEIGAFQVEVTAEAENGFHSSTLISPLQIIRGNHPPTISDLQAPGTVRLASQDQLLTLHVKASDPDGLADVQRVVFNSYRPDGTPSTGNPFQLYDDGDASHGDEARGDGIYSIRIVLPSTSQRGTYRFEFQASDRSNERSNIVVHTITVTQ